MRYTCLAVANNLYFIIFVKANGMNNCEQCFQVFSLDRYEWYVDSNFSCLSAYFLLSTLFIYLSVFFFFCYINIEQSTHVTVYNEVFLLIMLI